MPLNKSSEQNQVNQNSEFINNNLVNKSDNQQDNQQFILNNKSSSQQITSKKQKNKSPLSKNRNSSIVSATNKKHQTNQAQTPPKLNKSSQKSLKKKEKLNPPPIKDSSLNKQNKKKSLDSIPEESKKYDKSQYFSQSINFQDQDQLNKIRKSSLLAEQQNRGQSFQRSGGNLTQKAYNVSLASLHQVKKNTKQNESTNNNNKQSGKNIGTDGQSKRSSKNNNYTNLNIKKQVSSFSRNKSNKQLTQKQQDQEWLRQNLKLIQNQSLKKINEQYTKQIFQPLKYQSQLLKILNPMQRCIHHNTTLSLYCCIDRQLLCVGCVYNEKSHKTHRVVPMLKSQKQMKQDIQSFKNRIESAMSQSQSLIRQSSLNLIKIQKQYPALIHQIQMYYFQIHQIIEEKKKQQLQYIESLRFELKRELKIVGALLTNINTTYLDKIREIQYKPINSSLNSRDKFLASSRINNQSKNKSPLKNNQDSEIKLRDQSEEINEIVKKRCNYQILARFYKILNKHGDQLFDQKKGFQIKLDNFNQVLDLIKYKLTMVIPFIKKQSDINKKKGFTNINVENQMNNNTSPGKNQNQKGQFNNLQAKKEDKKIDQQLKNKKKNKSPANNADNQQKSQNKKGFSTSPQVPRGLSRRFIQVSRTRYSPKRNSNTKQINF